MTGEGARPAFAVPGGGDVGFLRLNIQGHERDGFFPGSGEGLDDYVNFLCRALRGLRVGTINATLKTRRGGNHMGGSFAVLAGAIGDPEGASATFSRPRLPPIFETVLCSGMTL